MDKTVGILVLVLVLVIAGFYAMNTGDGNILNTNKSNLDLAAQPTGSLNASPTASPSVSPQASPTTLPGGLIVQDIVVGQGAEVKSGDTISIHYLGTLENGTKFDSSYDRGQPFQTQIGTGQVIEGWDKGVVGMKVGGKRKLIIPPAMGYGDQQVGSIPANSTLIFEVELARIN